MGIFDRSQRGGLMDPFRKNRLAPPPEATLQIHNDGERKGPVAGPKPTVSGTGIGPDALAARPLLGLRIDVRTFEGLRQGVPLLLEALKEHGAKATFFINMGPDRTGLCILDALAKPSSWLANMRLAKAGSFGAREALSGVLLPPREIAPAFPDILGRISSEGHESGSLGWDSRAWELGVIRYSDDRTVREIERAAEAYQILFNRKIACSASPGFLCTELSLRHASSLGLKYGSDCRGTEPFLPALSAKILPTPQVPVTLPTIQECICNNADVPAFYGSLPEALGTQPWPVFSASAEWEGGPMLKPFSAFLERLAREKRAAVSLGQLLDARLASGKPLPRSTMSYGEIGGRQQVVSLQMLDV